MLRSEPLRNTPYTRTIATPQDLHYLNLAVNNITKVQNLQRCESLAKLDLTINFIPKAGLLSLASLGGNHALRELFLVGNPCADWPGYRQYVLGALPQLTRLDGMDVKPSERIAAAQAAAQAADQLAAELRAEGVDVEAARACEDDGRDDALGGEVAETGRVDDKGELRRPWCPATRILEHREAVSGCTCVGCSGGGGSVCVEVCADSRHVTAFPVTPPSHARHHLHQERAAQEADQKKAAAQENPFAPPPAPPKWEVSAADVHP